ncbi:hypothetical protein JCM13591A_37120 [Microbacterium xylanilyticum]
MEKLKAMLPPDLTSTHTARPSMTTQIAGPAKSTSLRTAFMPPLNRASCRAASTRNAIQPSGESPRTLPWVIGVSCGHTRSSSTIRATEASQVWIPYQKTAITARTRAGMLAPKTPKLARASTGYGTPVRWPA